MSDPLQIGDIVRLSYRHLEHARWVISGRSGSPAGIPHYVTLKQIRPLNPPWLSACTEYEIAPIFVERPVFTIGQRVRVNGLQGEIAAFEQPQIEGEPRVRVALDPHVTETPLGNRFRWVGHSASVPTWQLTLENNWEIV